MVVVLEVDGLVRGDDAGISSTESGMHRNILRILYFFKYAIKLKY